MCYIETSNLDGETNLKIRQVIILSYSFFVQVTAHTQIDENWKHCFNAAVTTSTGSPSDCRHKGHRQPDASLRADGVREPEPPSV